MPSDADTIELRRICLDFITRRTQFEYELGHFLFEQRLALQLPDDGDLIQTYLDRIWPDGLPGTLIISAEQFGSIKCWHIRAPVDGPMAESFAADGLVPCFRASQRNGRLVIEHCNLVPHVAARPFEVHATGPVVVNSTDTAMEPADLVELQNLPNTSHQIEQEMGRWRDCLDWRDRLIRLGQMSLPYEVRTLQDNGEIRFRIRGGYDPGQVRRQMGQKHLMAAPRDASRARDRWDPDPGSRIRFTPIGRIACIEKAKNLNGSRVSTRNADPSRENGNDVVLVITAEESHAGESTLVRIPEQGFVLTNIGGNLKPLQIERRSIERLLKGDALNPFLPGLLFDVDAAATSQSASRVDFSDPMLASLNEDQRAAFAKALEAPDIALIEGPGGTGKTEVIAALCSEFALRGRRVLLASQANLPVDNVLNRLPSDPRLRPLRVARTERVPEEFQGFLEDHVLKGWLNTVRETCTARTQALSDREQEIHLAEEAVARLRSVFREADEVQEYVRGLDARLGEQRIKREQLLAATRDAEITIERGHRVITALQELVRWAERPDQTPPDADLLLGTPLADALRGFADQLRHVVIEAEWQFSWLSAQTTATSTGCLQMLHRSANICHGASEVLPLIREAITLCGSSSTASSREKKQLRRLREEKRRLQDSEKEEDLVLVAGLNRQINALRQEGWSVVTRGIQESLRTIFGQLPPDLDDLITALSPEPGRTPLLERLSAFIEHTTSGFHKILGEARSSLNTQASHALLASSNELETQRTAAELERRELAEADATLDEMRDALRDRNARLEVLQRRWTELWPSAVPNQKPEEQAPSINSEALSQREDAFQSWRGENATEVERRRRWWAIQDEWLRRLADPVAAEDDRLRALYLRHTNIIGLTCNEAGQREFYDREDFRPFDVVIIDEVSKVTPTELLAALLIARKVILVGDYRQLPPMLPENEYSFAEAVEEGLVAREDFTRYRNLITTSLFGRMFAAAPETVRHSLFIQYRMHPQIMEVVNMFYDGRLKAGPNEKELGMRRQHHLRIRGTQGGWLLEPHQHVLWIDSSRDAKRRSVFEQQRGSSKINLLEVDLIVAMLTRLDRALRRRGYQAPISSIIKSTEHGIGARAYVEQHMKDAAPQTIDDVIHRGCVTVEGHAVTENTKLHTNQAITIDARKSVGVITFYGAQRGEIHHRIQTIQEKNPEALSALDLKTNTVDRFQGMEQAIVLVSLVRARRHFRGGDFVKQYQRINVAFSRAQELLVIVGAARTFRDIAIELPSLEDGAIRQVQAYAQIYELVQRFGGRRYADQVLF